MVKYLFWCIQEQAARFWTRWTKAKPVSTESEEGM